MPEVAQPMATVIDEADRTTIKLDLEILDTLCHQRKLRPSDVVVYLTLRAFGFNGTEDVFPGQVTIGNRCGLNKETVATSIKRLIDAKLIEVTPRFDKQGRQSDLYRILPVTLPKSDKSKWKFRKPPVTPKTENPEMEIPSTENPDVRTKEVGKNQREDASHLLRTPRRKASRSTDGGQSKGPRAMPRNGMAQTLVAVLYEDVLKTGSPTAYQKAVGQAQKLANAGLVPDDVAKLVGWIREDSFRSKNGIDMGTLLTWHDKWRATLAPSTPQRQPTYANSVDPYDAQLLARLEGEE